MRLQVPLDHQRRMGTSTAECVHASTDETLCDDQQANDDEGYSRKRLPL